MPRHTRRLIEAFVAQADAPAPRDDGALEELTPREREVLALVGSGLSNDDIAAALTVSPHTVKTHVNRTMTKLGAHDRAQLVIAAYESGLLRPGRD
jgi:DNA-binding NarL/FixJ family response regulator